MTRRAVSYLRLSNLTESSTSIDRQREECRARAEREGWELVAELADPNVSGAKARENAGTALAMLRDGRADVLIVAAFDRWSRTGLGAVADLVEVLDARDKAGNPAEFVTIRDGISSRAAGWRITAVVIAEVARQERENTSARVTASHAELAREGRWRGGTVPFGYVAVKNTDRPGWSLDIDDQAAAAIREAARRILAGETAYAVVRDFNERGVLSAQGKEWRMGTLVRLLTSERTVGRVIYRGEVLRDAEGMPSDVWPPVLDLETWNRLRARFNTDGPKGEFPQRRRAARLLSGLIECASCNGPCYVTKVGGGPAYQCVTRRRGSAQCARPVSIRADKIEDHIADAFLSAHGDREVYERVEVYPDDLDLADVKRAIGATTAEMITAATVEAFQRLQALQARRDEIAARPRERRVELRPTGQTYREAWEEGDTDARRALIAANYAAIVLRPATKTGRYAPVADRVVTLNNPAHALDSINAQDHAAGRVVAEVEDGPDWMENYPLVPASELLP